MTAGRALFVLVVREDYMVYAELCLYAVRHICATANTLQVER